MNNEVQIGLKKPKDVTTAHMIRFMGFKGTEVFLCIFKGVHVL